MLYLQFSNLKIRQNPTVRAGSSTRTSIRTPRETETTPGRCHFPPCKSLHNFSCEPILPAGPQSSGISRNIWRGEGKPSRARRGAAMPRAPRGHSRGAGCALRAPGHTHASSRPLRRLPARSGDAARRHGQLPTCNDSRRSLSSFGFQPHLQSEGISGQLNVCLQPQLITLATEIERPARGKGLLFVLYLPLLPPAGDMPRLQPSSGAPSSG